MISHIGQISVSNYISQMGQKAFKVFLEGQKNPIFSSSAKSNDQAVKEFLSFSDNLLKGNKNDSNIYHISIIKDSSAKIPSTLSETFYQYNDDQAQEIQESVGGSQYNTTNLSSMFGLMEQMIGLVSPFAKQRAENDILRQQINEIEAEPEEKENPLNTILAAIAPALLGQKNPSSPVAVAGVETEEGINVDLLNKAIEKLLIFDPDLPSDLMKLAEVAEKKPVFFTTLLTTLRNM